MALLDFIRRSLALKFVYYGPMGVGKTASLRILEKRLRHRPFPSQLESRPESSGRRPGRMLCLDTLGEQTIFFETLSIVVPGMADGSADEKEPRKALRLLLRLFTVPGGEMHRHTRRLLLRGADGIVLVSNRTSHTEMGREEAAKLAELHSHLRELGVHAIPGPISGPGVGVDAIPVVVQPSPRGLDTDMAVVEVLMSLLQAAWPAAQRLAKEAGLENLDLFQHVASLRRILQVSPARDTPPPPPAVSEHSQPGSRLLSALLPVLSSPERARVTP